MKRSFVFSCIFLGLLMASTTVYQARKSDVNTGEKNELPLKVLRDRAVKRISKTVFSKEVASILITLSVNRNPK